ncbi:hypothetical protein [Streptomyces sp. NPDC008121]|uniref:hypothetical protein n=1 Tax=Streptomyces sp. NPDC008121 TaxID=3364809 RepID=UPI0036EB3A0E
MRSGPIALCAAGAAAVFVLVPTAGSAYAHDGVRVTITPSTARPGAAVGIRVHGCHGRTGTAASQAFVAEARLAGWDGGISPLLGGATLRAGLQGGTYRVSVTCDGHHHRDAGTLHVRRQSEPPHKPSPRPTHEPTHRPPHEPSHRPTHEPVYESDHRPTHHATPVAPVRAGGGGAAVAFAAPVAPSVAQTASESGLGTPYTLVGLIMAAVAAVAVAFRSARRGREDAAGRAD